MGVINIVQWRDLIESVGLSSQQVFQMFQIEQRPVDAGVSEFLKVS